MKLIILAIVMLAFTAVANMTISAQAAPDPCNEAERPGGQSIGEWHESLSFNGEDCFTVEVITDCGSIDVRVTYPDTISGIYKAVWRDGAFQPPVSPANDFPEVFAEDENGGTAAISWWIEGPESDYFSVGGLPDFWSQDSETVSIETDCEPSPEPTPDLTTITVIKDTDPEENDEDVLFEFDIDPGVTGNFFLADDGSTTIIVKPGDYSVKEVHTPGTWFLDHTRCVGVASSKIEYVEDGVLLELSEGDDVTCTFTNILDEATPTPSTPVPVPTQGATDICDNIPGIQVAVPEGRVLVVDGGLVLCNPAPTVVAPSIQPPSTGDGGLK